VPGVVLVKKLIGISVAPTDVVHGQLPQLGSGRTRKW
jgi:hypothetical protein